MENLTPEEKLAHKEARKKRFEKNRGDHRHHVLDAMVISLDLHVLHMRNVSTMRPKIGRTKAGGILNKVKNQLMSRHPLFETFEPMKSAATDWMNRQITENRVQHHASKSNHRQAYKTSFFSRRQESANPDENFYLMREKLLDISLKNLIASVKFIHLNFPITSILLGMDIWKNFMPMLKKTATGFLKTFDVHTNVKLAAKQFSNRLDWSDFRGWLKDKSKEPILAVKEANDRITLKHKGTARVQERSDSANGSWNCLNQKNC